MKKLTKREKDRRWYERRKKAAMEKELDLLDFHRRHSFAAPDGSFVMSFAMKMYADGIRRGKKPLK